MKCKKYEVSVVEGSLAAAHGFYETIDEIFIPKYNICINKGLGIFRNEEPRCEKGIKTKKIEISEDAIKQIDRYLTLKEKSTEIVEQIFNGTYEERELVDIDISEDILCKVALLANEENKTLNEKVNEILEEMIEKYKNEMESDNE